MAHSCINGEDILCPGSHCSNFFVASQSQSSWIPFITYRCPAPLIFNLLIPILIVILFFLTLLKYLQTPLPLHLLWALKFGGAIVPTVEPGLIPDTKMKYFTLQYLEYHYSVRMIISPIIHILILNSKLIFLMKLFLVHMHQFTKTTQTIHIGMNLCM